MNKNLEIKMLQCELEALSPQEVQEIAGGDTGDFWAAVAYRVGQLVKAVEKATTTDPNMGMPFTA